MSRRAPLLDADVRRCLQAAVDAAGSQRVWAARHGLSQGYVGNVIVGRKAPGDRLLAALGLVELPRSYVPAPETRS